MSTDPHDASTDELLRRIVAIMEETRRDASEIRQMSEISFRMWLDSAVRHVSSELGIAVAKAMALLDDVLTIWRNGASVFREQLAKREGYRRIQPR